VVPTTATTAAIEGGVTKETSEAQQKELDEAKKTIEYKTKEMGEKLKMIQQVCLFVFNYKIRG